jgi:hypothetical protein
MRKSVKLVLVDPNELPYVVAKQPIMKNDLYLTPNNEIKTCIGGETRKELSECLKIMATPNQVPNDENSLKKLTEILSSGGEFELEMEDEFTNPKAFENVGWGDGLPQPILVDNKIVI